MATLVPLMARLASQVARGELNEVRDRAIRSLILASLIVVLLVVALVMGAAAAAVALASSIGLVRALLLVAAAAVLLALLLALMIRPRPRAGRPAPVDPSGLMEEVTRQVSPVTIVAVGLAAGLILGLRGRR